MASPQSSSLARRHAFRIELLLAAAAGFAAFRLPFSTYFADPYLRAHYAGLWACFAFAAWRSTTAVPWRRLHLDDSRQRIGLALGAIALLVHRAGIVTGSSTVQRLAIVACFAAWATACMRAWSPGRVATFSALALLSFGLPFSTFALATHQLRRLVVVVLDALRRVLPLDYVVVDEDLVFSDYVLSITPDCSGFNQVITFTAIALMGILLVRPGRFVAASLLVLGIGGALAANLVRVLVFVACVQLRWRTAVEAPWVHELVGLLAIVPFLGLLVWRIFRDLAPRPRGERPPEPARGVPIAALLLPFALAGITPPDPAPLPSEPTYLAGLTEPPGSALLSRGKSETTERAQYDTPHVLNAYFAPTEATLSPFHLFAYLTSSRAQLGIHPLARCLDGPTTTFRYGPPVEVGGRVFFSFEFDNQHGRAHGYYSYWIDGDDADDSWSTMFDVFLRRLRGDLRAIGLTRFLFDGPLEAVPSSAERALLAWRASLLPPR